MKKVLSFIIALNVFLTSFLLLLSYVYPVQAQQPSFDSATSEVASLRTSRLYVPVSANATIVTETTNSTNSTNLLITDYLASTRVIINDKGEIGETPRYYPYGSTTDSYSLTTDRLFTGHRKVNDLNIYHAGARFYSPQMGMFVQPDTVEGPNRFAYVGGNPVMGNDPSGQERNDLRIAGKARLVNPQGVGATGVFDPDIVDRDLMTDEQLQLFQAYTLFAFGGAAAGYAGGSSASVLGPCLAVPARCQRIATAIAEMVTPGLPPAGLGNVIGRTNSSTIYRISKGTVRKIFINPSDAGMLPRILDLEKDHQIETLKRFGGGLLPRFIRPVKGGYEMEFIDGVKLIDFDGEIPAGVIDDATAHFFALRAGGFRHNDLSISNIMVEVGQDGVATRIRLIDPARIDYRGRNIEDEVSVFRDMLTRPKYYQDMARRYSSAN